MKSHTSLGTELAYKPSRNVFTTSIEAGKSLIAQDNDKEPVLSDGRDYHLWQYTCKGRIVGVNGYVDKSRFMGQHGLKEIRYRH